MNPLRTPSRAALAVAALLGSLGACERSEPCRVRIVDPAPGAPSLTLPVGSRTQFSIGMRSCPGVTPKLQWSLDGQAVGANAATYTFFACRSRAGEAHDLTVEATTPEGTSREAWILSVDASQRVSLPACVTAALGVLHAGGIFGLGDSLARQSETAWRAAIQCLDQAYEANPCDLSVDYASAVGGLVVLASSLNVGSGAGGTRVTETVTVSSPRTTHQDDQFVPVVQSLLDTSIAPRFERLAFIDEELNLECTGAQDPQGCREGFQFRFDQFLYRLAADDPRTPDVNEARTLDLSGRHDLGEVKALNAVWALARGGLELLFSYHGAVEWLVDNPGVPELLSRIAARPGFLTLEPDGEEHLARSRAALVEGIRGLENTLFEITSERHDQASDLLRYWDCGRDGLCPPGLSRMPPPTPCLDLSADAGDPAEPYDDTNGNGRWDSGEPYDDANGNGTWNDAWAKVGPDADGSERDGRYEAGEPVGTDALRETARILFDASATAVNALETLATSLETGTPLDLDTLLGLPAGSFHAYALAQDLPEPVVDLGAFFDRAPDVRNLVPLFHPSTSSFVLDSEGEPFKDYGFDCLADRDEPDYDPVTNPDPNGDDLAATNATDCRDNNANGLIDWHDPTGDRGVEGNGRFDTLPDGTSECWDDTAGIVLSNGAQACPECVGNGKRDVKDLDHPWPTGADVKGPPVAGGTDPRDTTLRDVQNGVQVIEETYYFLPDATFGGILRFPTPVVNRDGKTLTGNAVVQRFATKLGMGPVGGYPGGITLPAYWKALPLP